MRRRRRYKAPKRVVAARKDKAIAKALETGFSLIRKSKRGCKGYHRRLDGSVIMFRSALELTWFRIFDSDPEIHSWAYEPERIPYVYRGKPHKYVIDAIITYTDGSVEYVEIKPEESVGDVLVQVKRQAVEVLIAPIPNTTFRFLTETNVQPEYKSTLRELKR